MTLNRLRSLARIIFRDPRLIGLGLNTYALLIIMRGVIAVIPMRRIIRYLGTPMEETPADAVSAAQLRDARRISWMIEGLAPRTPTNSNCYPRALTARWLLHRRRIPSTLYYGAAFEPAGTWLEAHVWVRCGPVIVSGGSAGRRFRPLSSFADVPASRNTGRCMLHFGWQFEHTEYPPTQISTARLVAPPGPRCRHAAVASGDWSRMVGDA